MTVPHGTRVLVVEDEAMLALALQDMLADLGCKVGGVAGAH
jgi:CheY-like chemotaxis protein